MQPSYKTRTTSAISRSRSSPPRRTATIQERHQADPLSDRHQKRRPGQKIDGVEIVNLKAAEFRDQLTALLDSAKK